MLQMLEGRMAGHNRPPADPPFSALKRLAMIREALLDGTLSKDEALAQITYWTIADERGELVASIETWCLILRSTNRKRVRGVRDTLLDHSFEEVERGAGAKIFRTIVTEDEITEAVQAYREGVSDSTPKGVSDSTSPQVSDDTPGGINQYPLQVSDDTPKQVSNDTPASRAHVSYPGDIKNISPPREAEAWIEFLPGPGQTATITEKGRKGWVSRGLDDEQIDLLLIESPPKLNTTDWLTAEAFNGKMQMFFAKACREEKGKDRRYSRGRELNSQEKRRSGARTLEEVKRKYNLK